MFKSSSLFLLGGLRYRRGVILGTTWTDASYLTLSTNKITQDTGPRRRHL